MRRCPFLPATGLLPDARRNSLHVVVLLAVAWLGMSAQVAVAHPISVVTESAFVERDKVTVDIEVFAEDLYFFHGVKENDAGAVGKEGLREAAGKHGALLLERLPVFDAAGRRLKGEVISVTGDEFPEDILPGELMGHSLIYRLEFPLSEPPEFLTFSQRLVDSSAGFPALVDFRIKQAGRDDEAVATLKPNQVRTIRFEWEGETALPATSDAVRESWMKEQRDDALGATSLNTIRSFLYIAKREVRHELLIPFPLVESFITVDRADPDFLTHDEQQVAKPKIGEFFVEQNPVTIDGTASRPSDVRVEFFTLDDRNLAKAVPRRTVSAVNCRIGLILTYPLERPANEVKLVWDAFNREAWRVDAFCFVGDEVLRPEFSAAKRKDTFVWNRPPEPKPEPVPVARVPASPTLTLPGFSILIAAIGAVFAFLLRRRPPLAVGIAVGCCVLAITGRKHVQVTFARPLASTPELPASETDAIVRTLHANLYRAADAATDEEVVEALAAAADGDVLRSLALQLIEYVRFGEDEGGTLAVQDVEVLSGSRAGERAETGGFDYQMTWDVTARLEHWGHVHDRRFRYDAVFAIDPREGRWVITEIDLRDVRMLEDESLETSQETASGVGKDAS
ncbi:MAG: hypothetical protein H0T47_03835 [Planctomycetaceae bacterium]|nr:hypothetical protein [Planctomycetaceae bacterium]